MRPLLLRFRGLHSYRGWQEVDFGALAHSGLFGIFGPTGAGKSTVPDAITLALYGSVERAARGTQGIINLSEQSCEVAFSFELAGHVYTAQRLFKRVKGDPFASKGEECRLLDETSGQVLADKGTEMTALVEGLLNMDMQRFCQTVILPQGKFDRFLRLKPGERGNMLEDIFHLQEYGDALYKKAVDKAKQVEAQILLGEKELALLGDCAPEQLAAAESLLLECRDKLVRAAQIRELAQTAWQAAQALAEKEQERQQQQQQLEALMAREPQMTALEQQRVLAAKAAALKPLLDQADARYKEQQQLDTAAEAARTATAAAAERLRLAEAETQVALDRLQRQLEEAQAEAAQTEEDSARLTGEQQLLQQQWQQADAALEAARLLHAAEQVAMRLQPGETCPVCGGLVTDLPARSGPDGLVTAEQTRERAFALWQQAGKSKEQAASRLAETQRRQLELNAALAKAQGSAALQQAREQANQAQWQARQSAAAAESGRAAFEQIKQQAIEQARAEGFESVAVARRSLLTAEELQQLSETLQRYQLDTEAARGNLERLTRQLAGFDTAKLPDLQRELTEAEGVWQALLVEEAHRTTALQTLRENGRRWQELRRELAEQGAHRDTARRLQALLKGKAFVRFLARERLRELAAEASHTIGMLSNQRYALQLFEEGEGGDFIIVDQYNGGQRRQVATLSGGEIFLVSLSLALALSRNIEMQGETLGFFFLDEGFGTLDEQTLETVMCILERLPSAKRLVGLISHVPEVRARLPRYLEAVPADGQSGSTLKLILN